jgi:hypothetical protein
MSYEFETHERPAQGGPGAPKYLSRYKYIRSKALLVNMDS